MNIIDTISYKTLDNIGASKISIIININQYDMLINIISCLLLLIYVPQFGKVIEYFLIFVKKNKRKKKSNWKELIIKLKMK